MHKKKVLIITYYWPPSGGAGVQRWVKMVKYFSRFELEAHVLTVREDQASYLQWDESLTHDVPPETQVYKTDSFEPINYYAKLVGKKNVPTAGFSNVDNAKWSQKLVNALRSNLFIPDPRKGWNKYAYRKAVSILRKESIDTVITTSPPHSTQLIGLKLQQKLGIQWIADMRDPWTDIYYYDLLGHTYLSNKINHGLEKKVLLKADHILTVSKPLKELFAAKDPSIAAEKIHIVPNGYDPADFEGLQKEKTQGFTIAYTGTMADNYKPSAFLNALSELVEEQTHFDIRLQFIGRISDRIKQEITALGLEAAFIPTVSHSKINQYQKNADLLLLVIPDVENSEGILTGKLFEYLASGNPIICIGPEQGDAAAILQQCEIGETFERSKKAEMKAFIAKAHQDYSAQTPRSVNWEEITKFSRVQQTAMVNDIVRGKKSGFG
ncbi:MAG: glycosyltransferase family 4 protein [Bacteroidota bacterium]